MTAKVLVVDDIRANVKLLEARLTAEYFEVITAMSGAEALEICERDHCDIVLLDVMMPGMDGFTVCRRLKMHAATAHIPVVMITALDQPSDRVKGLEAGADDFLTKPVNDIALLTRVKSLVRLKMISDELRMRAVTGRDMGFDEEVNTVLNEDFGPTSVMIVDDQKASYERLVPMLAGEHKVTVECEPQEALFAAAENDLDVILCNLSLTGFDALRLCSQVRSLERTRMLPILLIADPDENARLLRALDIGVNDYIVRPVDRNELRARVRTQIRRKRYNDRLRMNVQQTIEMAVTDALTGLHNRRYLESHLSTLVDQSNSRGKALSILVLDIDFFKSVNDTHGHDVGDEVLKEFALRVRKGIRGIDLACRFGGEEFVVVMPETDAALAYTVAERLRQRVAGEPFLVSGGTKSLTVTVSIGMAALQTGDSMENLLKRADQGLYAAKRDGRNRVVAIAA
ncbi:MAG: PleD family two-component system response regulator [Pseudomonadota bacterium]